MNEKPPIQGQKRIIAHWSDRCARYIFSLREYRAPKTFLFFFKRKGYWKNLMVSSPSKQVADRWAEHYGIKIIYVN